MKVVVITGSPHSKGTSALLADEFVKGVLEMGHKVFRFDAAFEQVNSCLGCDKCGIGVAPCVQKDAMNKLNPELLTSDVIVLVTPLYYFGFSAQIKTVIDRFYANSYKITGRKKVLLMATSYDANDWTMNALTEHYKTLARYMQWDDAGMLLATGCGDRRTIEQSEYPERAYQMGRSLLFQPPAR